MDQGGIRKMSNQLTNGEVFKIMEELAPKHRAYHWDNVGLQVGSFSKKVKKIMVTLDVLENVVDEAIEHKVDCIIAHHPLLFKPLKQINLETPEGQTIAKLIRHDITVYAAHTNLDIVNDGVNDMLAEQLSLTDIKPLVIEGSGKLFKYAVHVPLTHATHVKKVIGDAGGGMQGDYTHCSFEIAGTGAFKPSEGANPYIGEVGEITTVDEVKIEALVSEEKLKDVVEAVMKAHPYEEPAFDIIELTNKGENYGLGRIGKIKQPLTLKQFVEYVKERLDLSHVRVVGNLENKVKKVAVLGGSGEKYIHDAKRRGADVFITGDLGFHQAQAAMELGLLVIDAGHYIESIMKQKVCDYLQDKLKGYDVEVIVSKTNTDPFQYL